MAGCLALFPGVSAGAEDERSTPEADEAAGRWLPSIAVISGVLIQDWEGSARKTFEPDLTTLPMDAPPAAVQNAMDQAFDETLDGDDRDVTPFVGGSLELMTPRLPLPLSPRLFVGGELAAAFGTKRGLASEGSIGEPRSPFQEGATQTFGEDSALGQGTEVRAELDTLVYGAHAGVAFPVEFLGRQLRIKPSFAWIRYDIDVKGQFTEVECRRFNTNNLADRRGCLPLDEGLREISLLEEGSESFDGIGPRLDVEMDTGRMGPLGTSLFISTGVYRILGNRDVRLEAPSQEFPFEADVSSPTFFGTPMETGFLPGGAADGSFSFELDRWVYRVGLGLRLHWVGWD